MKNDSFIDEIMDYSYDDLWLIYNNQKDLYSAEELSVIEKRMEELQTLEELERIESLPKEIKCPKCDQMNPFLNDFCSFCQYKFDKTQYYQDSSDDYEEETDDYNEESYTFQYVISFIIPLVGFILGAILLSKESNTERANGKRCIIIGIISIVFAGLCYIYI